MPLKLLKSVTLFGRQMLSNPTFTGAAFPSSPYLGKRMASFICPQSKGWIVELGAGTGSVTQALLDHGIAPTRIISIEMSDDLIAHLRQRFPQLRVVQGDAVKLGQLIDQECGETNTRVDCIVSCLPFRTIPDPVCVQIMGQIKRVLHDSGQLIQFTYDLRTRDFHHFSEFTRKRSAIVLANLPPARVDLFSPKQPNQAAP